MSILLRWPISREEKRDKQVFYSLFKETTGNIEDLLYKLAEKSTDGRMSASEAMDLISAELQNTRMFLEDECELLD